MVQKGFVSLPRHSKSQRLAFVQASLHATRNTKEETKVSFEVYLENFSLPSSQKHDTNSKDRPSKRMSTDNNTQPEHKKWAASNVQPDSDVRLHIGRNSVKRKENAIIV